MRKFRDLQGNEFVLRNCSELDENTIIGFVVGTGATKIFNKQFEI